MPAPTPTPSSIYTTASSLLAQLQAVESLCKRNAHAGAELTQKRATLHQSLKALEAVEAAEKNTTRELQRELGEAMERAGGVCRFDFQFPARQLDVKLLPSSISGSSTTPTPKQHAKTNIFADCLRQIENHLAPAAQGYARLDDVDSSMGTKKASGKTLAAARRFLAEKMRQKARRASWEGEGVRRVRKRRVEKSQITHRGLVKRT